MAKRNIWSIDRDRVLIASLQTAQKKKQNREAWFKALHTTNKAGKKPLGSERTFSLAKCVAQAKKLIKMAEKLSPPLKLTLPEPAPRPKPKTKQQLREEMLVSMGLEVYSGDERTALEKRQADGIARATKARKAKAAKAKASAKAANKK